MKTTESYLSRDLSRLLLLAVAVILVVFFLGFRAKRAVLLPLATVLTGTVWCFGFMALVGFAVSMISVVIPALLSRLKAPGARQKTQVRKGPLTRGVVGIGRAALRARYWILALLAILVVLFIFSIRRIEYNTAAILCITATAFRSIPYRLYALVPLATGIMLKVIFMVLAKIPLDMITIMVSSIAIGVGVDDAIHFLIQFRRQSRGQRASARRDIERVIENTLSVTGRPIGLTTLSTLAGLLILSFAAFKPIRYFGVLVAFTLAATCIGTIVVPPAVLSLRPGRVPAAGAGR